MDSRLCVWILVVLPVLSWCAGDRGCYKELPPPLPSHVISELPRYTQDIPTHFDWRDTVTLSPSTNQFLPSPCGSCWAHAAVGALTDRIIISRGSSDHTPMVPLSPQVLLDCKDERLGTCHGGSALGAYQFIKDNGITDLTCSPYMGVDDNYWGEVPCGMLMCRSCDRFGTCGFVNATKQYVSEYGTVSGEREMMAEIYKRGPIACSVYAHGKSFEEYSEGVIQDNTIYNTTTHVVAITGWGVQSDNAMKYWVGRNSFGTVWGEGGWFKLERGVNALDIEKHTCAWAVPK